MFRATAWVAVGMAYTVSSIPWYRVTNMRWEEQVEKAHAFLQLMES